MAFRSPDFGPNPSSSRFKKIKRIASALPDHDFHRLPKRYGILIHQRIGIRVVEIRKPENRAVHPLRRGQ